MRRRLFALALIGLTACASTPPTPAPATTPKPAAAAAPAAPVEPPLPLWSQVKRGTLPNGLTYYIMEHHKPRQRALLWLAVNAGAVQEDDDQRGLAHFVEHMAFNGTKRFPEAAITQYLEKIGMGFGADVNAHTGFDETVYELKVPSDDPAILGKGLDILRDWASDVSFDPVEIDKERGVVLEEWRLGRGASRRLFDKQAPVLFKGSRYADRLPIGLPEIIKGAPRAALARFHDDWYRPELMAVIAVGDFDAATMEREILARFSDIKASPAGARKRPAAGVPVAGGTRVSIETDPEMPGQVVTVYNVLPHRPEATASDMRRIVVEQIYQSILMERLNTLARRPEAPFAAAFGGTQGMTREIDAFTRTAQVRAGRVEDTLRALFVEVLRIEKHGFTVEELERARTRAARFFDQSAVEEETRDSSEYTEEITRNFFEGELMIGRVAERDHALRILPTITLEELNSLAKAFGGSDNRVIVIAGQTGKPLPDQARVLAIVDEVEKSTIDPWQAKEAATALMAQPPKPGTIVSESKVEPIGVTVWTLSNGVKVIVKPTDFTNDNVVLSASSPGGWAMAKKSAFDTIRFADDVAAIGGVGELDDEALDKVLADKQVRVGSAIGEVTEGLEAQGSARDVETMLQLVYLRITAPRKDDQAIAVWRANSTEELTNQMRVPEVRFSRAYQGALFHGDRRRLPPEPSDLEKMDADRALAFYRDRFGDVADFTFVIVGSVDLAALKPMVETYLASLPAHGRREKERDIGVRRVGGVVKKEFRFGEEPKARVYLTFHGSETWTRDKERDMFILGDILSTRLREVLREDLGGVYGVGAGGRLSRSPRQERVFSIQFGCDPSRVDELLAAVRKEIAAISKDGIGADYVDKTKQKWLRQREVSMRQNGFWADWLESAYRFGDDPTLVLDPAPVLARMTPEHVKAAAKKYLDGKQQFQAVMLPETTPAAAGAVKAP